VGVQDDGQDDDEQSVDGAGEVVSSAIVRAD